MAMLARLRGSAARGACPLARATRPRHLRGHGIADWDLAYAYEALARASRVANDSEAVDRWLARAREAGAHIAEAGDRELLFSDLASI